MRFYAAKAAFLIGALMLLRIPAQACPEIYGIPDFNCDGDLQIAVLGDSVVFGFADTVNDGHGGYVLRVQKKLKKAAVQNLGVLGLRTGGLISALSKAFDHSTAPILRAALVNADIIVIDIGRNDFWLFGPPIESYRNIITAAEMIRKEVKKATKLEPMIVLAEELIPNRTDQGRWIKSLNSLVRTGSTLARPGDLHFDGVSKALLSSDGIHPRSVGYDAMAAVFQKYLQVTLPPKMRKLHPDTDRDGLPDIYETSVSHTNPKVADSDRDGLSDGEEVLILHTNPRVPNPRPTPTPTPPPAP